MYDNKLIEDINNISIWLDNIITYYEFYNEINNNNKLYTHICEYEYNINKINKIITDNINNSDDNIVKYCEYLKSEINYYNKIFNLKNYRKIKLKNIQEKYDFKFKYN